MPDAAVPSRADGSTRKRKRDAGLSLHTPQGDSNGAESSDTGSIKAEEGLDDVGPTVKPRRSAKAKKDDGPDGRRRPKKGLQPVECVVEWPERFKVLDKTHRALNLVFTFCCTRKHLATTFDTIKAAVESHTKRELLVADVAAVAALRPEGINFSFVDEVMLQMDVRGAERDEMFKTGNRGRIGAQGPAPDASVGGFTGLEELGAAGHATAAAAAATSGETEVLYFEFVDGDLKRQVPDRKTGEPTRPTQRLRDEQLRMPVYSHKQMTQLIERRNQKFANAVSAFVNRCVAEGLDAEAALDQETARCMPARSEAVAAGPLGAKAADLGSGLPESIPAERKSMGEIVQELKESPWYSGQVVPDGHRVFEAREAVYGELNFLMSQDLVNALYNAKGITRFYSHQAEAINGLQAGRHVVVATSTSSGKSLIYQLPVLHALECDANTRAMYIFPTKALAQDQKRSLREAMGYMPGLGELLVETFDGDTPWRDRDRIRDEARVVFTNPDMLHVTVLPQEARWRSFLQNLAFVVVDELHYYNGLLGSHMAFVMRRLRRICAAVGNRRARFVSCSATVANPREHFAAVFGLDDVLLVDADGSPSGRKEFLCWNTPFKEPGDPASGRGSALLECAQLFCAVMLRGARIVAFCRVREQCEKLVAAVRQELDRLGRSESGGRVMGYRGGYTAQDRRRIEADMFAGRLLGIVATSALELGVDIGSLDCVLTWGFPYSIANLRQQSGRAGRRSRDSLSVLVGDAFATDQHYMQNPDELFSQPNGALRVDLDNMLVREGHVQCAAFEMPIRPAEDARYFGRDLARLCAERLVPDDQGFYHCHDRFRPQPSRHVAIRDTEDAPFAIVDVTRRGGGAPAAVVLEELEASRATFTVYDGAIYLHQGDTYLVRDVDPDRRMARVERVRVDWTTEQRDFTDIDPVETEAVRRIAPGSRAYHGTVRITQNVFGYFKVDRAGRLLDAVYVDNPPVVRHTKGTWLDVPTRALDVLAARGLSAAAAIHAAQHALMSLLPNFVISLPGDVRTECKSAKKERAAAGHQRQRVPIRRKRPARLTFYDAKGGQAGSGINAKVFDFVHLLLRQALARVQACPCPSGCLECVASFQCSEGNNVVCKPGCEVVLKALLNYHIDFDALSMGGQPDGAGADADLGPPETIVPALPVPPKDRKTLIEIDTEDEDGDAPEEESVAL